MNYAVVVKPVSGVLADLEQDRLVLDVSLRVPTNFFGHYLNLTAEFVPQDRVLQRRPHYPGLACGIRNTPLW